MTYLPSIYKSTPQQVTITAGGTAAIAAVDTNYSRLTLLGFQSSNAGGVVDPNQIRVSFNSTTQLVASGQGSVYVLVEEFNPLFFRQAFQHGNVTIPSGGTSVTTPHGLTLGSKACVGWRGSLSGRGNSPSVPLNLTEAQVRPRLQLSGANIIATVGQVDYFDGTGTVVVGYTLMDPR